MKAVTKKTDLRLFGGRSVSVRLLPRYFLALAVACLISVAGPGGSLVTE